MSSYRGRFAPSPTGPLHFGSLFAALVSYLDAKKNDGAWLLRIEDIDPLREMPGASESIINTLEAHHLLWDEEVTFQSTQSTEYESLLRQLQSQRFVFQCPCSRKQLQENNGKHTNACIEQTANMESFALKFRKTEASYQWLDSFQGYQSFKLDDDFVLKRKEGFYAYQLAVVSDDIRQGITHVVRGFDLISSTPMQLALYSALNTTPPRFAHFPVLCSEGQKLSKQNHAKAINNAEASSNINLALSILGLDIAARETDIKDKINTAVELWNSSVLEGLETIPSPL